ncbi:MAG TPA: acetylornithine deacetylase [Thermoanaerobaculia bacterium]|nr:acetylornithine deacetylase [Thermoanaerobaculia bacterium]
MTRLAVTELLGRLIACDTTSSKSNLPLVDFLCDYLARPGVRIHRQEAAAEPKANLVVELGPECDPVERAGLVLSGHTDVVPAEEPGWRSDPFTAAERDGAVFGRGAADMKGFLAVAVELASRLDPATLRRPLVLLLTYDEELGTLGARHFHDAWPAERPLPRHALIGEPTELQVVRLHKGHLKARVTILGESAHSAYPHLGRNAIEPAGPLLTALSSLRRELEQERFPSSQAFPEVPHASLNVARVRGGTAINIVPDRCVVDVGVRLLPGMNPEALAARVEETAGRALAGHAHTWELLSLSPPMEAPADGRLVTELCRLAGCRQAGSVPFASDGGWLQRMDMECVLFGPGSIRVAHRPDEHVPLAHLEAAATVLGRLVAEWCQSETHPLRVEG